MGFWKKFFKYLTFDSVGALHEPVLPKATVVIPSHWADMPREEPPVVTNTTGTPLVVVSINTSTVPTPGEGGTSPAPVRKIRRTAKRTPKPRTK